jgi:diguanylate cyclase (GGDEF)-like protein/PAS domain S-box-containing protein
MNIFSNAVRSEPSFNPQIGDLPLLQSVEHFRTLLEHSSDLITMLTPEGVVQYASPSSERMLGYALEEWVGGSIFAFVHPEDQPAIREVLFAALRQVGTPQRGECRFQHRDGSWRVLEGICTASRNERGELGLVVNARDVSERVAQTEALRRQMLHDALTDLPNRTLFRERLQRAIVEAYEQKKPLALLLLDLNRFREINDTFGHQWGDTLLQQVSTRLRGVLRKSDPIARLGGDEFAVLLPNTGDEIGAQRVATRLVRVLEHGFVVEGRALSIGASIGAALYPEHGDDADTLMRRAEIAMYTAKRAHGDFAFYQSEHDFHTPERLLFAGELQQAIACDQLLLHYQPKENFVTGQVCQVEALVRWRHPERGLVPPDQFIPLAEQTGLIRSLCHWVLNDALHQCALWKREGLRLRVAVNLSMCNLQDPGLPDVIVKLLARWDLDPSWLEVEITESALAADPGRTLAILTRLHNMGVRIAIDDFGTGYSSLAYLKRLPVDTIKIDKSFVMGMATEEDDATIVRSTIELGHNLGLQVVAEGIEDVETWNLLKSLGCDFAQGYFLSRPLPAKDFTTWVHAARRGGQVLDAASFDVGKINRRIAGKKENGFLAVRV